MACEPSGVSVAGNISTLACMKERSGRPAITLAASSLRFSSFLGFLSDGSRQQELQVGDAPAPQPRHHIAKHHLTTHLVEVLVFSMVDIRRAKASATRLPELPGSSLAVVSS